MITNKNKDLGKRSVMAKGNSNSVRWGSDGAAGWAAPLSGACCNFATWNVRSLLEKGKMARVIQEMEEMKIDILGLAETETWWKDNGEFMTSIPSSEEKYKVIFAGGQTARRVVGFILKQRIVKAIINHGTPSERIIYVKIQSKPVEILLIQVYAPTENAEDFLKDSFYADLEKVIKENKKAFD